jgi:hypothetical protein
MHGYSSWVNKLARELEKKGMLAPSIPDEPLLST